MEHTDWCNYKPRVLHTNMLRLRQQPNLMMKRWQNDMLVLPRYSRHVAYMVTKTCHQVSIIYQEMFWIWGLLVVFISRLSPLVSKFKTQDDAYKGPDIEQWLACAKLSPTSLMYMSDGYNDYRWQRYTLREDRWRSVAVLLHPLAPPLHVRYTTLQQTHRH